MTEFQIVGRIARLARPELGRLAFASILLVVTSGLTLVYPQVVKKIIDGVTSGGGREIVDQMALLLLVIFGVNSVLTALRMYLFTVSGQRIVADMRHRLYRALVFQEIGFFDANLTGELTNRISSDTSVVQSAATSNIASLMRHSIMTFGALTILCARVATLQHAASGRDSHDSVRG